MDIRVLRSFLAVARAGTITKAAEQLHITQPSLSKQLMDLEQELGSQLLIRGKRQITLTEDGIRLRRRAEELVTLMDKTEREFTSASSEPDGEISIGGTPTDTVLQAAARFRREHPLVSFQFYHSDATEVSERLDHGSLDFAILLTPVDSMKYEYRLLPEQGRWGLFMPETCDLAQKQSIKKEDLLQVPLIFHRRAGLQRQIARWAETEPENFNIAATYNVLNGSPADYVLSGLGYFLTSGNPDHEISYPGVCFRYLDPPLTLSYALVWKRYPSFNKAAELFLKLF